MPAKVWITLAIEFAIFALLLFASAGTITWPAGWAFLILFFVAALIISLMLARHDPALLEERMKMRLQRGQPLWDKIFLPTLVFVWLGWLILMGLDTVRWRWSDMPTWLQIIGGTGIVFAFWIFYRTYQENTFLAAVVKIQRERGHRVISTGPYAVVRHPLYAGALILLPSTALLLGSWYGLLVSIGLIAAIVFRTIMEDRMLMRELEGYPEYAARVRYRLVPFAW